MEHLSEANAAILGLLEQKREAINDQIATDTLDAYTQVLLKLYDSPFILHNTNTNSDSSSIVSSVMEAINAALSRLEAQKRGEITTPSRSAMEDFQAANATKKKGKKSRNMPKACYGAPLCTNALCEHLNVVPYTAPHIDVEKENNIIKALRSHCEKARYPVTELYAKQSLHARDWKIAGAWKAIKTNIDERENKYKLTGRTNWDRVNHHADRRPNNPLGAKEPRNDRIKYLEDDDACLHEILTNNWNSTYGKDIKQQFPNDKIKQKRQYQLYRREAYYRSERAKFRDSLPLTRTSEENVESMQDFDDINEPLYNLAQLPDEEDVKKAQEALAAEPEAEPEPEPEKPIGPYTKQYNELRAKMVRDGNLPTSGWLPSHGDIEPGHENVNETSSSPSANPLNTTAESIQVDDGASEYAEENSTVSPRANLPPMPRIRSPFAPSLTIEDLEGMTPHEQQLQFLIRANGRDIMYEKLNALNLSLNERVNHLKYLLKVYSTDELDEKSREALQFELLKYQSHQERLQAKDYKTVEKLPTEQVVVRFDNHGNEANETEELRGRDSENLMRPEKHPAVKAYESQVEQPGGFMGLGFQHDELERMMEDTRTSAGVTPEELQHALDYLGKKQEMDVLPKQKFKPGDAAQITHLDTVLSVCTDPEKLNLNFDISKFAKQEIEEAKEAKDAEEQESEPELPKKAKGKRPIRPWEQNIEHQSDPVDLPSPIMKQKYPKLKKRERNLFKQLSKNTIESKIADMGFDDETVVLSKNIIESKIADLGLDDDTVAKIVQRLSAKDQSRMSFFTEEFHVHPASFIKNYHTFDATRDPDAEEDDVDDFFADDTTGMDDLQEPFPELDEESTTSDKQEYTTSEAQESNGQEAETPKFSGATVPPSPPIPEPLDDTDRALQEIAIKTIAITNQFFTAERELFNKFMGIHILAAHKLSTGPWRAEDVGAFLSFVEETPAQGISIELICKLLGLCNNDPVRAHAFFKSCISEISTHFGLVGVRDASWEKYEALMLKWESFYWLVLKMTKEVMENHGIEWVLT